MLQKQTLKFLSGLQKNNNKGWMDANRSLFVAAKEDFEQSIDEVIKSFGKTETSIASFTAKQCVFRQNRDVRFSKDKSPYKINMGAYLNSGGKKSNLAGYYFHCEPGNKSFVGGGLWMPETTVIKKVRQEIDYCFDEFSKMLMAKPFKETFGDLDLKEHALIREPKGYEKDNPAIKYLKLKSFVALQPLTDADLTGTEMTKKITQAFSAIQPLIHFLNRSIEE